MERADDISISIVGNGNLEIEVDTSSLSGYPSSLSLLCEGSSDSLAEQPLDAISKLLRQQECIVFRSLVQGRGYSVAADFLSDETVELSITGDESAFWKSNSDTTSHKTVPVSAFGLAEEIVSTSEQYINCRKSKQQGSGSQLSQRDYQRHLNNKQMIEYYRENRSTEDWAPSRTRAQLEPLIWCEYTSIEDHGLEPVVRDSDIIEQIVADLASCSYHGEVEEKYHTLLTERSSLVQRQALEALNRHPDPRAARRLHGAVFDEDIRSPELLEFLSKYASTEAASGADMDHFATLETLLEVDLNETEELGIVRGLADNDASEARELLTQIQAESEHDRVRDEASRALN